MYEMEKENLKKFSEYIARTLRPSFIKGFMTVYLTEETTERILSEEGSSVTSAAHMLLEKMWTLEKLGWFQAFLDELRAAGYTGLYAAITKWDFGDLERMRNYQHLLERIRPSIIYRIKPNELLPHMNDCLTLRECEEINSVGMQRGQTAASEKLVDCLRRSDKQWFKTLTTALYNCDFHQALELLEHNGDMKQGEGSDMNGDAMKMESMTTVCIEYKEEGESYDGLLKSANELSLEEKPHGSSDAGTTEGATEEKKKLRAYQTELATAAFKGENTIICAPTGCGKTIVALAICEHHLKKFPGQAKIVFMATKVDVYAQQYKLFQKHFSQDPEVRITGVCGDMDSLSMKVVIENYDIVVLTPQILVNALQKDEVPSLEVFTLLVFDECHNTTGKHPYNIIMTTYLDQKLSGKSTRLPQIVGLTASVGIGSFKSQAEAENNISLLCASLDVRNISTVTEHLGELRSYVHTPEKDFFWAEQRSSDPFTRIITNIMSIIEGLAKTVYDIDSLSNIQNREYGSQKYEQWIVDVQKHCKVLRLNDPEEESRVCRALFNFTEHLRKYNDALIINEDARTKDALEYLDTFFQQVRSAGYEETERKLTGYFDAQREQLLTLANGGQQQNPKLEVLQYILDEEYHNNDQTRTVLFVRTRALADALKKWIEETDSLKFLKPGVLIGRGKRPHLIGSGMSLTLKKDVLESFKTSDQSKILIATSVADEGIDIPQCNLVLMYEYVGNVVKMVQVRGRGRAQGSRCFLISSRKERIDKEKLNMEREKLVEKAIKCLQASPENLHAKVDLFQREEKARRDLEKLSPGKPRTKGSYELLCCKCKKFACLNDDLRVLEKSHHIILDRSIFKRCVTKPHPNPKSFCGIQKTEKMACAGCQHDWGIIASYMNIQDLPVVKIESFVVQDRATRKQLYFRKWRDVTFTIKPFDMTEMTADRWGPREQ
ncbi:antiviral innate immune response receptor RIG-I [Chanos chanos]|uniref:Activating signal cointegrator 1 complex subunit 3 n=1 Tax=Chanos chanos TaxID=29144 RepID=A0A6J2VAP4_CHACN|nr:probable ATP-dependent RNA helicase DDX58 [Chanos chanos]